MQDDDTRRYLVVLNDEEQYSIWPDGHAIPEGWKAEGTSGSKAECLEHIGKVWTDIRPLSLRKQIEQWEEARRQALLEAPPPAPDDDDPVDDLVRRLGAEQVVEVSLRPEPTPTRLREAFDRGRVYVRFVATGTELGIPIDREGSDSTGWDAARGAGVLRLSGRLVLNYNRVEFKGSIDVATMRGVGALRFIEAVSPGDLFAR